MNQNPPPPNPQNILETADTTNTAVKMPDTVVVSLDESIARGAARIESLTLRRPNTGALRGLSLMEVAQMNVNALQRLLPRITEPVLTEADVATMSPADLTACAVEIAGFLLSKKDRQAFR